MLSRYVRRLSTQRPLRRNDDGRLEALADVAVLSNTAPVPERGLSIGAVPDPPAAGLRPPRRLRHSGRLHPHVLRPCSKKARSASSAARARTAPASRPMPMPAINGMGAVVRDVLRRRAVGLQLDRRGLCREIAGRRHHAARRAWRSGSTIRSCTTRCATSARRSKSSRSSASPATELDDPVVAFREIDRVLDAAARLQAAGATSSCRATWSRSCRRSPHLSRTPRPKPTRRSLDEAVDEAAAAARQGRAAGDHRRRRNPSLRPARQGARPGRKASDCRSPRRSSARASSPKSIRSTSASTKGRWGARR